MKKSIILGICVLVTFLLIVINYVEKEEIKYPNDFNFTYKYGVNGKESIDTYNEILKYDSVEGILELEFKLSIEEKNQIYLKMSQLNFMQIHSDFPRLLKVDINPISVSELIGEYQNEKNEVRWSTLNFNFTNFEDPTEGNVELKTIKEIGDFIEQIINERLKNMDLPDKRFYL